MKRDEIICIIDRSGSMGGNLLSEEGKLLVDGYIDGLNDFILSQRKVNKPANITFVLFDHEYDIIADRKDINSVELFDHTTYVPRGSTALLDAIGSTIDKYSPILEDEKNDIDSVIVCILTDGEENASQKYTRDQILKMTSKKMDDGWLFVYLAANQDTFKVAASMGITGANTTTSTYTDKSYKTRYSGVGTMSSDVMSWRIGKYTSSDLIIESKTEGVTDNNEQ